MRRGGQDDNGHSGWTRIYSSVFVNNYARGTGGAICANGTMNRSKWYEVYDSIFANNTAEITGDTLHAYGGNSENKCIVKNCVIRGEPRGRYHIHGGYDNGFDEISNCNIQGGIAEIADNGAEITNITSSDPFLDTVFFSILQRYLFQM